MIRSIIASTAVLAMAAQPAFAETPEVSPELIETLAGACTAEGAFGYRFGERRPGGLMIRPVAAPALDGWPMLDRVMLGRTPRTATVVSVVGVIRPEVAPGRDPVDAAEEIIALLGDEAETNGQYVSREDDYTTMLRSYEIDDDATEPVRGQFKLELYEDEGEVWISCLQSDAESLVWAEATGRGQSAAPVRPHLALPPRPARAVCDDPAAAEQLVASLDGLQDAVWNSGQRGNQYFADLNGWYDDQLEASGKWDDDRGMEFAMSILGDPVIGGGIAGQLDSLGEVLGHLSDQAEAQEAGDGPRACAAGVAALNVAHDMVEVNRRQWDRIVSLYHAEADRLGVVLKD